MRPRSALKRCVEEKTSAQYQEEVMIPGKNVTVCLKGPFEGTKDE